MNIKETSSLLLILAACYLLLAPEVVAGETRNVLMLYSNTRLLPANIEAEYEFRKTIEKSAEHRVELYAEFLDVPRFTGESYDRTVAKYLHEKYVSAPPEVIVVTGGDALKFLLRNRAQLFPKVPVVHMRVPKSFLQSIPQLPNDVVGVPIEYDFSGTIEQALRWHPKARHLVVVTGTTVQDREWEARLRNEVTRFKDRATAEFLAGLPTATVQKRLAELGGDAVVFTPGYYQDGEGRMFNPRDSVEAMAAASAAPVYGPFDTFIGTGVVGGRMPSFGAMGRQAAQIVNELFGGAAPASLSLPEIMPTELHVDWRQARRWGIDEKNIPVDAVVNFREPTFWEAYRNEVIIVVAVILLQAALIIALLIERRLRRSTAVALGESDVRFRTMADTAPVMIWMSGTDMLCTFFNKGWLDFTGRTMDQELGNGWAEGVHRDDLDSCIEVYINSFNARQAFTMEYRLRRFDGEYRWVLDNGVPRFASDGTFLGYIGTAIDITERKQAELEIGRQRNQLAHLSRVTMLGELSGALAHELNQPLTAILSNAQAAQQFLRRDGADLDEVQEILKDIVDEDKRASEVIRRLRVLLTKGHVQLQPLDLNELVQDVLKIMRADLLYNGVSVNTELAPDLPVVNGDRVQLQQVLLNLMINGCDAMADTPKHERNLVVRTGLVAGEGVRVSVADQGCGIPPNERERVFEPFITTKKQGMGLGLAVCRTIIAAHGGKLWVENNPGRGATFTFSLKRKERGGEEALHTRNRQSVIGDQYGMINESNAFFDDTPSALKEDNRDNLA